MRFGATNNPLQPLLEEIKILAALGFDYLELCLDPPEGLPETIRPNELTRMLEDKGLEAAVAHLPASVWLADIYDSIRKASVKEVISALDMCSRLGIKKAVLHPGYLTGLLRSVPDLGGQLAFRSLDEILDAARERDIMICLENMFPRTGHMYRPEEMAEVLDNYPDVMMTFDIGHACIKAPANRPISILDVGAKRIRHLHVSDNNLVEDDHLPIGEGSIQFEEVFSRLKRIGYDDTMTLEVFTSDREYLRQSLNKVKAMWTEA
jgi:sugar phosphate isomerase/epimerase